MHSDKGNSDGTDESCIESSCWKAIILLFLSGCTVALHIGKVPSALPELRQFWHLSLTQSSLVVSVYALLIASAGIVLGLGVKRFGFANFAVTGVGIIGLASIFGSLASAYSLLLATRVIEGLGWIMAAISIPPLLSALCSSRDQPLVMGLWGAFVPLGAGTMLLISPHLQVFGGWQLSWQFCGVVSLLAALTVRSVTQIHAEKLQTRSRDTTGKLDLSDLRKPVLWLICGCFFIYSFQFTSVTSFMPSLVLEISHWKLGTIGVLVALVVISNAIGNILAGVLLRRGHNPALLLFIGLLFAGGFALMLFDERISLPLRMVFAFGFSIFGGLVPGTCFGVLPRISGNVAGIGLLIGLMLQCSGFGQLVGPVVLAASVDYSGNWHVAGLLVFGTSLLGVMLLLKMRRHCT